MSNKNTFSGLGAKEAEFMARLSYEKKTILTVEEIDSYLPTNFKYRNQFVYNLKRKKILAPIKKGFYLFTPLEAIPSGMRANEFLIPPLFFPRNNYYIGYSTMFNYYGFTDQLFQIVYVINTTLCKDKVICGVSYKFMKVSANRMYGVDAIKIDNSDVMVSSKERTLIDLIYFNKPIGGANRAVEILKEQVSKKRCDIKTLIEYATLFPNITVRKRIGVALESIGIDLAILQPLVKSVANTALSSLTGTRQGKINSKWKVIINAP